MALGLAANSVLNEAHIRTTVRSYAQQPIRQATTNTGHALAKGFVGTSSFYIEAFAKAGAITTFTLTEFSALP